MQLTKHAMSPSGVDVYKCMSSSIQQLHCMHGGKERGVAQQAYQCRSGCSDSQQLFLVHTAAVMQRLHR